MAENQRVPKQLDCGDLANSWPNWKRNYMVYMIANNKNGEDESTKIAIFLWLIGTQGANIYNTLFPNDGSEDSLLGKTTIERQIPAVMDAQGVVQEPARVEIEIQRRTVAAVIKKFDEHCLPQKNVAMESYKFNTMVQKERQSFAEFETDLRTQLERCDFKCACGKSYEDRMLRDRVIIGVHDKKLQLKLLDGRDEQLDRVIDTCKTYEAANVNKGIFDSKQTVANIKSTEQSNDTVNTMNRSCFNCGGNWKFGHLNECKAKDVICHSCGKKGTTLKCAENQKIGMHRTEKRKTTTTRTATTTTTEKRRTSLD